MKSVYFFLIISILSCNKKENQKPFIVSEFNRNLEKHFKEEKRKNPELLEIGDIQLYDYPKGKLNFVIAKNDKIYYYQEDIINGFCGTELAPEGKIIRTLSKDSLHITRFQNIKLILAQSKNKKEYKNSWGRLYPISFIFESDTITKYKIQNLLNEVDSLGYHQYNVRRIAPFEKKVLD